VEEVDGQAHEAKVEKDDTPPEKVSKDKENKSADTDKDKKKNAKDEKDANDTKDAKPEVVQKD